MLKHGIHMSNKNLKWLAGIIIGGAVASVVGNIARKKEHRNTVKERVMNVWERIRRKLLEWLA